MGTTIKPRFMFVRNFNSIYKDRKAVMVAKARVPMPKAKARVARAKARVKARARANMAVSQVGAT